MDGEPAPLLTQDHRDDPSDQHRRIDQL